MDRDYECAYYNAAFNYNMLIHMREKIRIRLIEIGLTGIAIVGIMAGLGIILFIAFKCFDGWNILIAILVEFALFIFIYHLYRWYRYPGLFESKSSGRLLSEVLLSVLLIYSLPLIAIMVKLHIAGFLPFNKIFIALGLDFRFKVREQVQISALAPVYPNVIGRIKKIRVATENDISRAQYRSGEVIYSIHFANEIVEMPEKYLLPVNSVRQIF
jgi:hypothetical protein